MKRWLSMSSALMTLLLGGISGARAASLIGWPYRSPAGSNGGYRFYDLRAQASNKSGAPALSRVRSGHEFWITVYVRTLQPARTHMECRYTLSDETGPLTSDRDTIPMVLEAHSTIRDSFNGLTITPPPGMRKKIYRIQASVTLNGVTQTRTIWLTVSR